MPPRRVVGTSGYTQYPDVTAYQDDRDELALHETTTGGLTALFWSNINPYGTFRLEMGTRLDLGLPAAVPHPRTPATDATGPAPKSRHAR
ncbi:hypothetical protein [Streptomyces platensis]|uniref:hypothetical protein n=1 Tax=Streptomyces platensis TaxID=58346 RepID=UPI0036C214DC